jgi:hypothetical protein
MGDILMKTPATSNFDNLLKSVSDQIHSNGDAVSRFGARLVVHCKFIAAVLPHLSQVQCEQVTQVFRQGIEDAMAHTDDIAMPSEYYASLLNETNLLLNALRTRSDRR